MSKNDERVAAAAEDVAPSHDSNDELRKAAEKRAAAADRADSATRGDERGFVER